MKNFLIATSILLSLILMSSCNNTPDFMKRKYYGEKINLLDPNDFERYIDSVPGVILLDVRTPQEFDEEHISNALNLNYNDSNFSNMVSVIDTSSTILLYCRSGRRSNDADIMMKSKGYKKVYQLDGGIKNWKRSDKMIVK